MEDDIAQLEYQLRTLAMVMVSGNPKLGADLDAYLTMAANDKRLPHNNTMAALDMLETVTDLRKKLGQAK